MNSKFNVIDAHAHCGIQDQSMPQSFEDYRSQIRGSGIEAVVMFSPVMEIYDRYQQNFTDNADWQQRRKISNEHLRKKESGISQTYMLIQHWHHGRKERMT